MKILRKITGFLAIVSVFVFLPAFLFSAGLNESVNFANAPQFLQDNKKLFDYSFLASFCAVLLFSNLFMLCDEFIKQKVKPSVVGRMSLRFQAALTAFFAVFVGGIIYGIYASV